MNSICSLGLRLLTAPLLAVLVGCGSSATPGETLAEAKDLKSAGDFEMTAESFRAVLASAEASDSERFQAQRDLVVCEANSGEDARTGEAFADLTTGYAGQLDRTTLQMLGSELLAGKCNETALDLIKFATPRFEGDAKAKEWLEQLSEGLKAQDSSVTAQLQSLGYLGD